MADLRIGLDIDDTLCKWNDAYCKRFNTSKLPGALEDHTITKNVVRILKWERNFWLNLEVKHTIDFIPTLYCTSRVNNKEWTKQWLKNNNFPNSPVYQIYGYGINKATRIKGKVDVFIDDSIQNMIKLNLSGVPCLLMDSENNKQWGNIGRIYSLDKKTIHKEYDKFMRVGFPNFKQLVINYDTITTGTK